MTGSPNRLSVGRDACEWVDVYRQLTPETRKQAMEYAKGLLERKAVAREVADSLFGNCWCPTDRISRNG
jgi:hypothetical protein